MSKGAYITGLDLGSTKTCVLVCQCGEDSKLEVRGFGVSESKGWRRGLIVNMDSAVLSVKKAVEAAEESAGVSIDNVYAGFGGPHVSGASSRGALTLGKSAETTREVKTEDVRKVFQLAQGVSLPPDRKLVYAERQEYLLDSQNGIRNPVGMVGSRLEVNIHLILGSASAHENVVTAVNRAGIVVNDTVFEALAAAESCLTPDERELGVALADVGGGSSHLICYHEGSIRHSASLPVGGEHFTNDLAVGLLTPIPEAEKIKMEWGRRDPALPGEQAVEVPSVGDRPARMIDYRKLNEIIEPRAFELLELVQMELSRSGLERQLGAGMVFAGGGAKLGGLMALAERTLKLPARLGQPSGLEKMGENLLDPALATVVGLVIHGYRLRHLQSGRETSLRGKLLGMFRGKGD
ncbi:MAG: cell division protein FtsA [Terriglobia bacterium]